MRPAAVLRLVLAVLPAACASHRNFTPRENQNGYGPGGQPAAVYALAGDRARGEVRLWSRGSDPAPAPEAELAEVHVGFELENTGQVPLQLAVADLQCDEIWVGEQRLAGVRAVRTEGDPVAAPGTTARFQAWFPVGAVGAREVAGFAVRFRVDAEAVPLLLQVTPFAPFVAESSAYDDPWFWRGGFGFGWHSRYRRW